MVLSPTQARKVTFFHRANCVITIYGNRRVNGSSSKAQWWRKRPTCNCQCVQYLKWTCLCSAISGCTSYACANYNTRLLIVDTLNTRKRHLFTHTKERPFKMVYQKRQKGLHVYSVKTHKNDCTGYAWDDVHVATSWCCRTPASRRSRLREWRDVLGTTGVAFIGSGESGHCAGLILEVRRIKTRESACCELCDVRKVVHVQAFGWKILIN